MCYALFAMLRGRRSCAISGRPSPSPAPKSPLSPIIPVHPRNSPVSLIIPVHTQKQGGWGRRKEVKEEKEVEYAKDVDYARGFLMPSFTITSCNIVGAPTFLSVRRTEDNPRTCPAKRDWPLHKRRQERPQEKAGTIYRAPMQMRSHFAFSGAKRMFSKTFLLTCLRTLVPATPFFSHASLKHPGVAWAPSNSRLLCNLRTLCLASSAHTPYRWAIALRLSQCHNEFSGQLPVRRALCARRFRESHRAGQETFLRSVVSNKLSGRGLGMVLPIRSAKRPVAGKRFLGRPPWRKPAWASSPASAWCWGTS